MVDTVVNTITVIELNGIRIAAINGLTSAQMEGKKFDEETLKILKQKSKDDENEYVRIRAASLVKEAQL